MSIVLDKSCLLHMNYLFFLSFLDVSPRPWFDASHAFDMRSLCLQVEGDVLHIFQQVNGPIPLLQLDLVQRLRSYHALVNISGAIPFRVGGIAPVPVPDLTNFGHFSCQEKK